MKKGVGLLLLGAGGLGVVLLGVLFRKPASVEPPPSGVVQAAPSAPVPPAVRIPVPAPLPLVRSQNESADPLIQRWRQGIRTHQKTEVLETQSELIRREEEYRPKLLALTVEDPEPRIRAFTVAVLGRLKSPPPEDFFLERTGDAHEFPRTSALQALENLGTAACLAAVERLAAEDPAPAVRTAAAQAAKAVRSRGR